MLQSIKCALVLLMSFSAASAAQDKNVPVIASVEDSEEAIALSLQIRSDLLGVYVNESVIQSGGDWVLDTNTRFTDCRPVHEKQVHRLMLNEVFLVLPHLDCSVR